MPETKNELVLYTNVICPYAQRAHLVLNAKKVPYHVVYMDLWKKAEWYTQKSPTGKVPALALTDQADPLIESLIIADYFDEKYPKDPLHPKNAYQKAHDRVFVERFNSVSNVVAKIMYPMARNNKKIENVDEVAEELFCALDPFETELGKRGSNFFGGDKTAMIDYMIWPWMERTMFLVKVDPRYGLNDDRFKNIVSSITINLCFVWLNMIMNLFSDLLAAADV